jgi:chemotaxis protein histidine kinase CheA
MPFSQDDLIKFKGLYIETSRKYLEDILQAIATIKQGQKTNESVHSILIPAHSLAGQSQIAGYGQIAQLCTQIQTLCIQKETAHADISEDELELIEKSTQKMLESVGEIEKGGEELDLEEEIASLEIKGQKSS